MPNPYHLELVKQGPELWNRWRADSQVMSPELSGANLSEFNLSGYQLAGSDLCEANLCRANLSETDLSGGNLSMAYLMEANFFRANLSEANLVRGNMAKANCFGANFTNADLSDANLSGANFTMADLTRTNMTKANFSLVNFIKTYFKDTIGMPHGVYGIENTSSVPVLTPAIVHQKRDLITREMLGERRGLEKSEPILVHISIQGRTNFFDERTLLNAVLDVMNEFGFDLTGNPKISEESFFATIRCQEKECRTSGNAKEVLASLFEGFSKILKKNDPPTGLIPQQTKALENLMTVFRSISNQLTLQIDNVVIRQSFQVGEACIGIHQISEALRKELANNPKILMSSHLLEKILDDQKSSETPPITAVEKEKEQHS